MADEGLDGLGPVDYLVVEFPAGTSHFTEEMASELAVLVESELIRVLDILILVKDADGEIEALELSELDSLDAFRAFEAELAEVMAEEDVLRLAVAMEPGSTAGVIIWENTWAAPFSAAVRRAGGQLIADGRIPAQALVEALEEAIVEEIVEEMVEDIVDEIIVEELETEALADNEPGA